MLWGICQPFFPRGTGPALLLPQEGGRQGTHVHVQRLQPQGPRQLLEGKVRAGAQPLRPDFRVHGELRAQIQPRGPQGVPLCPAADCRRYGGVGDVQRAGGRGDHRLLGRQDKAQPRGLQVPGADGGAYRQGQLGEFGVQGRGVQGERGARPPDLPLGRDDPHQHGPLDRADEGRHLGRESLPGGRARVRVRKGNRDEKQLCKDGHKNAEVVY